MRQLRRAAMPPRLSGGAAEQGMRSADSADRIVVVDAVGGIWRVRAAHMEPLNFRSADEAERAGRRVAQTLARLGFEARLDTYGDDGGLIESARFAAAQRDLRLSPRRQLDS